jgi:hypothetical protein
MLPVKDTGMHMCRSNVDLHVHIWLCHQAANLVGTMAFPRRATLPDPAAQPAKPALCCEEEGLSNIFSDKYWRQLCPQLHVNHKQLIAKAKPFKVDKAIVKDLRSQIDDEGVFQVRLAARCSAQLRSIRLRRTSTDTSCLHSRPAADESHYILNNIMHCCDSQVAAQQLPWSSSVSDMAAAVATLIQYGWPSSFLLVFDEVWAAVAQVAPLMKEATGNECNMDILAWWGMHAVRWCMVPGTSILTDAWQAHTAARGSPGNLVHYTNCVAASAPDI